LNLTAIPLQAAYLKASGVQFVFVGGTTGESLSLSTEERMQIVETWSGELESAGLQMVVHVGHDSLFEAIKLAQHALANSAVAIAAHPPVYFKPQSMDALVLTMSAIAAAAPSLPFYYYHFPAMTGSLVGSGIVEFVQRAAAAIPTFTGLKYTDTNMLDVGTIVRWRDGNGHRYQVLMGKDEMMDDALMTGVEAFVGSTYNYAAPVYHRMIAAFASNNMTAVQLEQSRSQQFIDIFASFSGGDNIRGNKYTMTLKTGITMGPPRLPQMSMTPAQVQTMNQQLQAIGFYDWSG